MWLLFRNVYSVFPGGLQNTRGFRRLLRRHFLPNVMMGGCGLTFTWENAVTKLRQDWERIKNALSTAGDNAKHNIQAGHTIPQQIFAELTTYPLNFVDDEGAFDEALQEALERKAAKREIFEANKISGKTAEEIVTEGLNLKKSADETVYSQVKGTLPDGTSTTIDDIIYDEKTEEFTLIYETKSGGSDLSTAQKRTLKEEPVKISNNAPPSIRGKTISTKNIKRK